jgi:hypothetical protein
MISDYLKAKLSTEIPGILTATSHLEGGKQVIRINEVFATVGPFASDREVEAGIRLALNQNIAALAPSSPMPPLTPLPTVNLTEPKPMAKPTSYKPGELKGLLQGLRDRHARVMDGAVDDAKKAHKALDQVEAVMGDVNDTTSGIMSELGQFSNMPDGDEA